MTTYLHYCDHCGRNAPEDKPVALERRVSHYTPCTADGSGNTWATVWVTLCPDCNEPLTCRSEYTPIDLDQIDEADEGSTEHHICPYCGDENWPWDWREGEDVMCGNCENTFAVEAEYEVTWFTKRRE